MRVGLSIAQQPLIDRAVVITLSLKSVGRKFANSLTRYCVLRKDSPFDIVNYTMNKRNTFIGILFWTIALGVSVPPLRSAPYAYGASDEKFRTIMQADLAAQSNPDGLMISLGGFRRWVKGTDKDLGIPSGYLQTGLGLATTPAYGRASVHAEWLIAVFARLRVQYDLYRFYGTNSSLLSFPSATASFGSADIDALDGTEEAGSGSRLLIRPTLYAKAGPVIIVNQTDFAHFRFTGTGPYFLEWTYETLLQDGDHVVENRTNVLFQIVKGSGDISLMAGPYYEIMHAAAADLQRQRAGFMAYWVPREAVGALDRPRFFAQIGRYIEDRNREGDYMASCGMGFDLDL